MKTITKEQVFDQLEKMGVVEVEVHYSGGGDEGAVEYIELTDTDGNLVEIPGERDRTFDNEHYDLAEILEQPVEDELGTGWYDGVPGVQGYVYWKVPERKVTIEHMYEDWVTEDEKEITEPLGAAIERERQAMHRMRQQINDNS